MKNCHWPTIWSLVDNRESEYQMKVAELENQLKNYISIEENLQSVIVAQKESLQAEEILKQDLKSKITVSCLSYSFISEVEQYC